MSLTGDYRKWAFVQLDPKRRWLLLFLDGIESGWIGRWEITQDEKCK